MFQIWIRMDPLWFPSFGSELAIKIPGSGRLEIGKINIFYTDSDPWLFRMLFVSTLVWYVSFRTYTNLLILPRRLKTVLGIRDSLVRIQIFGSVPGYLWLTDPDADPNKYGSCGTLLKSHKEVTKQKKSRFFLLFLLDDGRIRIRMQIREAQKHTDPQHWFKRLRFWKKEKICKIFTSSVIAKPGSGSGAALR